MTVDMNPVTERVVDPAALHKIVAGADVNCVVELRTATNVVELTIYYLVVRRARIGNQNTHRRRLQNFAVLNSDVMCSAGDLYRFRLYVSRVNRQPSKMMYLSIGY